MLTTCKNYSKTEAPTEGVYIYMQAIGLMAGDSAGNFNSNKELTRAEAATVFMRMDQKLSGNDSSDSFSSSQSRTEITLPSGMVPLACARRKTFWGLCSGI